MAKSPKQTLQPRRKPVQARSAVTVEAILDAAIQVLLAIGSQRLTTTRVAARAGVSVGTLYQYFPNKGALLQAATQRHVDRVGDAVERACIGLRGASLAAMADGLIAAYLTEKMRDVRESAALYTVSASLDGASIRKRALARSQKALAGLLVTAPDGLSKDPEIVARMVLAALNGVVRPVLEERLPERALAEVRGELTVLVQAYLRTCAAG